MNRLITCEKNYFERRSKMSKFCLKCGAENKDEAQFCEKCGYEWNTQTKAQNHKNGIIDKLFYKNYATKSFKGKNYTHDNDYTVYITNHHRVNES